MRIFITLFVAVLLAACTGNPKSEDVINVYSHRHYDVDKQIFENFEKETGIRVNVVSAGADELIVRLQTEGERSPADLLITSDAGRLHRAQEEGLLQAVNTPVVNSLLTFLREPDGFWTALTVRARVLVYAKDRVDPATLTRYEDLADEQWKGRILVRSSTNVYNQSLLASMIANLGDSAAAAWTNAVVANFARAPRGNDRDQIKSIAAGEGDVAFVNTYYLAKMLMSDNAAEREAANAVGVVFPNVGSGGTHINISGMGLTRYAPNKDNAIRLMEYLLRQDVQSLFAEGNYEYPVNPDASASEVLTGLGKLVADDLPLAELGRNNRRAVELFNSAGWD